MKNSIITVRASDNSPETFRIPMAVNEIRMFSNHTAFSVCPRCRINLEREYQSFCDRCGQALDWKYIDHALVIKIN